MLPDFVKKYKWDFTLVGMVSVLAGVAAVVFHGQLKIYTPQIASISPMVFAAALLVMLTIVGTVPRARWTKPALHILVDVALLALFAPATFLKVEIMLAPYEAHKAADAATVARWIATNHNLPRLEAWSRLLTMSREEQDAVARALAPMLLGNDPEARASAELTLAVALRKHSLATLTYLQPELTEYLSSRASGRPPSPRAEKAGQFAEAFVQNNVGSIRKALEKDKRDLLPPGGLAALFLALATDPVMGPVYLGELARHGDDVEHSLAVSVMHLAAISVPTT